MSSKFGGYMGKVMMVDLTHETVSEYQWTDEQRELYIGGKIMAAGTPQEVMNNPKNFGLDAKQLTSNNRKMKRAMSKMNKK